MSNQKIAMRGWGNSVCVAIILVIGGFATANQAQAQTKDLGGKVVLANVDKYEVSFRAGKTTKKIAPRKASILSPKKYPITLELWTGNTTTAWEKTTINEAGVYLFKFTAGRWFLIKRSAKPKPVANATASQNANNVRRNRPLGSTPQRYAGQRSYQRGVGSRPRVVQRGGGSRVVANPPQFGRPWRGSYWHPLARGIWAAGSIYRFVRDEQDRDLVRRLIVDREIDDVVRREWEDRIWDKINRDAVNLPAGERAELERAWDELRNVKDSDWKQAANLPAEEWDQIRDQLKDDFNDQDWQGIQDEIGEIGDTMDLREEDIDTMDEAGIADLEQDVDLGDLDGADIGDAGQLDFGDVVDTADLGDFSMEAEDLDFGDLSDMGGQDFDLANDFGGGLDVGNMDMGNVDGGGFDSYDYGDQGWGGGNDWGGGDIGGGDWGGGDFGGDDFGGGDFGGDDFGGDDFGGGDFGGDDFGGGDDFDW